jgi:hypothetical protein
MATLSFSCPKCDKQHERIKPEMIGHKVQCQCGYVFRIGAKASKKPGVVEELKRKKASKKSGAPADSLKGTPKSTQPTPMESPARSSSPPQGPTKGDVIDAEPLHLHSEYASPVDAVPVDAVPMPIEQGNPLRDSITDNPDQFPLEAQILDAIPIDAGPAPGFQTDRVTQIPEELLAPQPPHVEPGGKSLPRSRPLSVSPPKRPTQRKRRSQRSRSRSLDSPAGPVWTVALSIIGIPVLVWILWRFVENASLAYELMRANPGTGSSIEQPGGGPTFYFVMLVLMCFMFGALAISLVTSLVVAIIEISQGVHIGWATKLAAIVGGIVLISLLLTCGWQVVNLVRIADSINALSDQIGKSVDTSQVGIMAAKLIGWHLIYAIIPFAIVTTGFCRNLRR